MIEVEADLEGNVQEMKGCADGFIGVYDSYAVWTATGQIQDLENVNGETRMWRTLDYSLSCAFHGRGRFEGYFGQWCKTVSKHVTEYWVSMHLRLVADSSI